MNESAMTTAERAELQTAMDTPMTNTEAVQLITQLVLLASELAKVAAPPQQMEMAVLTIRSANMLTHVAEQLLPQEGGNP